MAEEKEKIEEQRIPLRFRIPQKMPSVIAQHMTLQPSEDGVLLSFFEVIPPLIPQDFTKEQTQKLVETGITAECVSKVFVPASRYADFVKAMASIVSSKEEPEKE